MKLVVVALTSLALGAAVGIWYSKLTAPEDSAPKAEPDSNRSLTAQPQSEEKTNASPPTIEQLPGINGQGSASLLALAHAIERFDSETLQSLVEQIDQMLPTDPRSQQLAVVVFTRLAQLDPDTAMEHASALGNREVRQVALGAVVREIASRDLGQALRALDRITEPAVLGSVVSALARSGVPGAAAAAIKLLEENKTISMPHYFYGQVYSNWAREDLSAAMASIGEFATYGQRGAALAGIAKSISADELDTCLGQLDDRWERTALIASVIESTVQSDPQKALSLLASHGKSNFHRRKLFAKVATGWMLADPEAAHDWIEALENPRDRTAAIEAIYRNPAADPSRIADELAGLPPNWSTKNITTGLLRSWAERDPGMAGEWLKEQPDGALRDSMEQSLLNQWARSDPASAADFFSSETLSLNVDPDDPAAQRNAVMAGHISGMWAKTDPAAALAWLDSLEADSAFRGRLNSGLLNNWSSSNPQAAAEHFMTLAPDAQSEAIGPFTHGWAYNDFDAAQTWVEQLPDGNLRDSALNSLISSTVRSEPHMAVELYTQSIANLPAVEAADRFGDVANNIARGWADTEPAAAADWVATLPNQNDRPDILKQIMSNWARFQPQAASEWISDFAPGPDRDGAIVGLLDQIKASDPEAAFAWASSIDDEDSRSGTMYQTIDQWRLVNPEAARNAVEEADLTEELRQHLLGSFSKQE